MSPAYSCRTLTGNWYEERLADVPTVGSPSSKSTIHQAGLVRQRHPDTFRTQTVDFPSSDNPYKPVDTIQSCVTTKQDMDSHLSQVSSAVQKPKMVNQHNLREVFKTHRAIDRPARGFGALLPLADKPTLLEAQTTSQHFYSKLPAEAVQGRPEDFQQGHNRYCSAGKLYRDSHTVGTAAAVPSGRCGNRGELTRHPGESGSMYGISTFVDEYATWGTQLLGEKRCDVDAKKQTLHFRT